MITGHHYDILVIRHDGYRTIPCKDCTTVRSGEELDREVAKLLEQGVDFLDIIIHLEEDDEEAEPR